jgi:hypothetical protein
MEITGAKMSIPTSDDPVWKLGSFPSTLQDYLAEVKKHVDVDNHTIRGFWDKRVPVQQAVKMIKMFPRGRPPRRLFLRQMTRYGRLGHPCQNSSKILLNVAERPEFYKPLPWFTEP